MIMHFLGGFWVALALVWLFFPKNNNLETMIKLLLGTLLVGIAWEFFEFFVNANIAQNSFDIEDTLSDLFFDMFGGGLAVFYF
jgi:RsiW-degrading membrane proteinase PrsW (M82 family)